MHDRRARSPFHACCISISFAALALAACMPAPPQAAPQVVQVFITATPAPPTPTSAPTQTPTSTPTPTPTAPAIQVSGDPLAGNLLGPTPQPGAYCGVVDTLDFPLDPPDGASLSGGRDFGVYRSRYGKFHAGEDWGFRGGGSFGAQVHAIGHGTVTYADGLGWGADQGVVIIRHHFPDGSTVLSFYGHLDPPSVALRPGACVARGDPVGNIGRPRTSPHLHFEIRTTMPHVPGPGYWADDPTTAGWLPPSQFIWHYRMRRIPGVAWTSAALDVDRLLGPLDSETFVILEGKRLAGLYTPGGGLRWIHELDGAPSSAAVSAESGLIFAVSPGGVLTALRIPQPGEPPPDGAALVPAWERRVSAGATSLAALPGGGVVAIGFGSLRVYDADGNETVNQLLEGVLYDWAEKGNEIYVSLSGAGGGTLVLATRGLLESLPGAAGLIALAEEGIYFLSADQVGYLAGDLGEVQQALPLPPASRGGDILALPGGGVVAVHIDFSDRRLIRIQDGKLVWERSLEGLNAGSWVLARAGDQVYLVTETAGAMMTRLHVYAIEVERGTLELVFEGGSRAGGSGLQAASLGNGVLLIRFGSGELVALAP